MATREENLKKLNDDLEKLDDDELDNVAGGMIPPKGGYKIVPNDTANLQNHQIVLEQQQGGVGQLQKSGSSSSSIK